METSLEENILEEIKAFRARRETSLRREYGWLSLAGLFWLQQGDNDFGSAAGNPVRLPARAPRHVGAFRLKGDEVTLVSKTPLRMNGSELLTAALQPDTIGKPDYVFVGDIRVGVIERAGRLAIRIWDPQSPVRRDFKGCVWFPPDLRYRVTAKVDIYPEPRQFMIDDIVGIRRPVLMHAALSFELSEQNYRLDSEWLDDGSYDLIFKDATAGLSTYGAGRYLTTEVANGDQVVIDFNKAYYPPCAFTAFATCPLPLPQNVLPAAIEAGERYRKHEG